MYPNPSTSSFLHYKFDDIDENSHLTIFSQQGHELLTHQINSNLGMVDIGHLNSGLYLVILKNKNSKKHITLLKE